MPNKGEHVSRRKHRDRAVRWDGTEMSAAETAMILTLLERLPAPDRLGLLGRHLLLIGVGALGLWGLVAGRWGGAELALYFGVEFGLIWGLNLVSIALLPTDLERKDRRIALGWAVAIAFGLIGAAAYLVFGGESARGALIGQWTRLAEFVRAGSMQWPLLGLAVLVVMDFATDVAAWRRRGGAFFYASALTFSLRLYALLALGLMFAMFAYIVLRGSPTGVAAGWLVVFLLADLFALWTPVLLHRKAVADGLVRVTPRRKRQPN